MSDLSPNLRNELFVKQHTLDGRELPDAMFRNTLLGTLFPDTEFLLVHAKSEKIAGKAAPAPEVGLERVLAQPIDGKSIDFASGSRKHGVVWYSDAEISRKFFTTSEAAIAYGSNLVTECQGATRTNLKCRVVADGEFGTGDCHAKASPRMWDLFGADAERVMQFRLGVPNTDGTYYLAKGTAQVADTGGYDLILPESSFKSSFKPELGDHDWADAGVAAMAFSSPRKFRVSFTISQWFSTKALAADVVPGQSEKIDALRRASTDPLAAKRHFLQHHDPTGPEPPDEIAEATGETPEDRVERHRVFEILKADTGDKLFKHPYIQSTLARYLRTKWLEAALSGGMEWDGRQGIPDDELKGLTISSPDMPEGRYIMTRYPLRSRHDLILVENRHVEGVTGRGVVAMSHATAKLLAGDFDGDYFVLAEAVKYPHLAAEVERWNRNRPVEVEKEKVRKATPITPESLAHTTVEQMDNPVGLITYHISAAARVGREDAVEILKQELQYAVDGFKFNVQPDMKRVHAVGKELEAPIWWVGTRERDETARTGGMRDPRTFRDYALRMDGRGSVGYLARNASAAFIAPEHQSQALASFADLVPKPPAELKSTGSELKTLYGQLVAEAIKYSDDRKSFGRAFDTFSEAVEQRIAALTTQRLDDRRAALNGDVPAAEAERIKAAARTDMAKALWHSAHAESSRNGESKGSMAFFLTAEIQPLIRDREVSTGRVSIIGIQHNDFAGRTFRGERHPVTVRSEMQGGTERFGVHLNLGGVEGKLGLLAKREVMAPGPYHAVLTTSESGKTVSAVYTDAESRRNDFLPRRDDSKWPLVREHLAAKGVNPAIIDGLHARGKLWAAEFEIIGNNGRPLSITAAVVPTVSPLSPVSPDGKQRQSGALIFAVEYTDRTTNLTKPVDFKHYVRDPENPDRGNLILHAPRLRAADATARPETVYVSPRLDDLLKAADRHRGEKASFVLAPPVNRGMPFSSDTLNWLVEAKPRVVVLTRNDAEGKRTAAEVVPELRTLGIRAETVPVQTPGSGGGPAQSLGVSPGRITPINPSGGRPPTRSADHGISR